MKKLTEQQIQNAILDYLNLCPGVYWRNNSTGVYDPVKKCFRRTSKFHRNGIADILGIRSDGTFVAIEVKTEKGRLTDNQKSFLKDIEDNNGVAFVARSIEDVRDRLFPEGRKGS